MRKGSKEKATSALASSALFAHIFIQRNDETETVAVKRLHDALSKEAKEALFFELEALRQLNHENIVKFFGICSVDDGTGY